MTRNEGANEPDAAAGGAGAPPRPDEPNRAPPVVREYSTDRITVEWRADLCIHSANCVRSLPNVFNPRRRPWIDADAAEADDVAQAVLRCPSGALRYVRHDDGRQETPDVPTTLTPIRNGPLYVRGDLEVRGLDGRVIGRASRLSLCRCGLSRQAPLCDNTCRDRNWREPSDAVAPYGPTGGPESDPPSSA
jgi:uncharacterized Fe-S cluster protein YjdI